jgi:transposase InsO family protein
MGWKNTSVREQRIEFVIRASRRDANMSLLCREYGISRPTGYRWLSRYRDSDSLVALRELSRRPHQSPSRTSTEIEDAVVALRLTYDWGGKKIKRLLSNQGMEISIATANRIIKRNGLVREYCSHPQATKRFERKHPNQLWQMDFKGDYRLAKDVCYPLSIIDDHSRFLVGLFALNNQLGNSVKRCLVGTFERYGLPDAILTDHGIPWWGNSNGHGLTRLTVGLIRQGIRVYFSGVGHPQTQGKVERFHRTLKHALWYRGRPKTLAGFEKALADFCEEYNRIRPHEALDMDVPHQRYKPSQKEYNPTPPEWEYPAEAVVCRLNSQGSLDYQSQRYFICEALADERVQVDRLDNKLVVSYRHMYVREIEPETGRSKPLLQPAGEANV